MSTISVQTHFAAGHRILGLGGAGAKCRNVHGHTFTVRWTIEQTADAENPVEFGALKDRLKKMVKATWDHQFILDKSDDFLTYLSINSLRYRSLDGPPTTERIAEDIATETMKHFTEEYNGWGPPLAPDAALLSVELGEGPENTATWENPAYAKGYSSGGHIGIDARKISGLMVPGLPGLTAPYGSGPGVGMVGGQQ